MHVYTNSVSLSLYLYLSLPLFISSSLSMYLSINQSMYIHKYIYNIYTHILFQFNCFIPGLIDLDPSGS